MLEARLGAELPERAHQGLLAPEAEVVPGLPAPQAPVKPAVGDRATLEHRGSRVGEAGYGVGGSAGTNTTGAAGSGAAGVTGAAGASGAGGLGTGGASAAGRGGAGPAGLAGSAAGTGGAGTAGAAGSTAGTGGAGASGGGAGAGPPALYLAIQQNTVNGTTDPTNDLIRIDIASGVAVADVSLNGISAIAYRGGTLLVPRAYGYTRVSVLDPNSLAVLRTLLLPWDPARAVFSTDGRWMYAGHGDRHISRVRMADGVITGSVQIPPSSVEDSSGEIEGLALDPTETLLVATTFRSDGTGQVAMVRSRAIPSILSALGCRPCSADRTAAASRARPRSTGRVPHSRPSTETAPRSSSTTPRTVRRRSPR